MAAVNLCVVARNATRSASAPPGEHGICIVMRVCIQHSAGELFPRVRSRTIKEALMKALFAAFLVVSTFSITACGQRQVEVTTGAQPQSDVGVHFTNNTSRQVNVYVVHGGQEIFIGQVSGNSTQHLSVANVPSGSVVTLKATTVGTGGQTYSRPNVTLTGTFAWQVP
jgi:hypothetical protein